MASPFGINFVPDGQDDGTDLSRSRPGAPKNNVQEAIKVLSLRLPKFYGSGRALSPDALLSGAGGMGQAGAHASPTALALAQMAGLSPAAMAGPGAAPGAPVMPSGGASAPILPSGGGTDSYGGWAGHERGLGGASAGPASLPSAGPSPLPMPTMWPQPNVRPGVLPGERPPVTPAPTEPGGPPGFDQAPPTELEPGPWNGGPSPFPSPRPDIPRDFPPYDGPSEWGTVPEPVSSAPPGERPGRNGDLMRKYLDMLDSFGGGGY